jgi:hypothetical protein
MSLQTTAEVKVIQPAGKRATMPNITYKPKEKWGGSVPAFFETTKRELDIADTLTPGKRRRSTRAHEFEVRAVVHGQNDSAGHWEDKFDKESSKPKAIGLQRGKHLRPRPRVGSVRVVSEIYGFNI